MFLLAGEMFAQDPADPPAPVTYDFAEPFKVGRGDNPARAVIQASPTDDPAVAVLFGPASTAPLPELTAELVGGGQQPWKLEIVEGAAPTPPGATPAADSSGHIVLAPERQPQSPYWSWTGKIKLTRQGNGPLVKPPEILFRLGDKTTTTLIPSEIWYFAGAAHLSEPERFPSSPESGSQILEPVQSVQEDEKGHKKETLIWQPAKSPGLVANAFVRELRKDEKLAYFPITVYCVTSPRAFLKDWLEPGEKFPLTAALWHQPSSFDKSPACRGLVWWHGDWEADCHPDISDEALAAKGESALVEFRKLYGDDLVKVLDKWRKQHDPSVEIRVVQLPSVDHRTADLGFSGLPGATHRSPLSSWSAVRYAQYDAVEALKDPKVRLYPLLPTAPGSPGYQQPEPPPKAWLDQFGQRGVASQLKMVGASLARTRGAPPAVKIDGATITVTGLQQPETGSSFKPEDIFDALSKSSLLLLPDPKASSFTKDGLVLKYSEDVFVFRTKASDQAESLRTLSGELMPAFSILLPPPPQP